MWILSQGCSDMPCERDTPIFTTQGLLTSFEEMSASQCCLGWGLSVCCYIDICTQIYTRVGLGVNFNVHHMKYALHSALCFLSHPPFISLGIPAQINPFKAHNDYIETKIFTWKLRMLIPNDPGNSSSASRHTEVCAPKIIISAHKMFAIFVAKIW